MRGKKTNDLPAYCKVVMHPWRLMMLVLGLVFCIEAGIMFGLSTALRQRFGDTTVAVIDALLLTVLLVPCFWGLIVLPLCRLASCRQHFIDWALMAEERKARELSRELHDGIGQLVTAISVGLKSLENSTRDPNVIEQASQVREISRQLHDSIRNFSRGLRPTLLDDLGLAAAVGNYVNDISVRSGTPIFLDAADLESRRFHEATETALFRILQEALTNAIRHGNPTSVRVTFSIVDQFIELTVIDNGRGFDPDEVFRCRTDASQPFGMISIRERAALLGGRATIASQPGQGTTVLVRVPMATCPT